MFQKRFNLIETLVVRLGGVERIQVHRAEGNGVLLQAWALGVTVVQVSGDRYKRSWLLAGKLGAKRRGVVPVMEARTCADNLQAF